MCTGKWTQGERLIKFREAVVALCFEKQYQNFIQPKMLTVFFKRILPPDLEKTNKDTTLCKALGKRFDLVNKTAQEAMTTTEPSRQVVGLGTKYRHLAIVAPPRKYDRDRPFEIPQDEANRLHFKFLKEQMGRHPDHAVRSMDWDMPLVQKWFDDDDEVKKAKFNSKKLENVVFPPIFCCVNPGSPGAPGFVNAMVIDPWSDCIVGKIHSPYDASIEGEHSPEVVAQPFRIISGFPSGYFFRKNLPKLKDGEWYDTSKRPRVWVEDTLPRVSFPLTNVAPAAPPAKRTTGQLSIAGMWGEGQLEEPVAERPGRPPGSQGSDDPGPPV